MLRNIGDIRGLQVDGSDGPIGQVVDIYFDDSAWTARFAVVRIGDGPDGREVLIPPPALGPPDWREMKVVTTLTRGQVLGSPRVDTHKPVSRQHEVEQYGYYGFPYSWGDTGLWGAAMLPRELMAADAGLESPATVRRDQAFVASQAEFHRRLGDDPHLRSCAALIRYHVHATDGDIGHVEDLILDDQTWAIRYLVVNTSDWWLGHHVLVVPQWIDDVSWLEATVSVDVTRQALRSAPRYDPDRLPDHAQETEFDKHHRRSGQRVAGAASIDRSDTRPGRP